MLSTSRFLFLTTLAFAPLAFGSVEPWAFFVLVLLVGAAITLFLAGVLRHDTPLYRVPCLLPLALLGLYLLFQIIPLPQPFLSLVSPRAAALRQDTIGILLPKHAWPVSLDIHATLFEFCRWLLWVGFYWLSVQLLSDKTMLRRTLLFLAFFGGLFALSSILQNIFTEDHALWFRYVPDNSMVFGSYVCHNHYAGLMAMIFGPVLALVLAHRPPRQFGSPREKVLGFFEEEETPLFILLILSAAVIAMSIFASLSRGGILSLCVSMLFFALALSGRAFPDRRINRRASAVLLLCAVIAAVTWFGWERIDNRFAKIYAAENFTDSEGRFHFWADSLKMVSDFPATGVGFGAFGNVIPAYQNRYLGRILDHAHNDYLELLAEGGIPGVVLAPAFFICLFKTVRKVLKKRKEPCTILVCAGTATGILAILLHGVTDFNLHIPANALYLAFLCGLLAAAAHTRLRDRVTPVTYLQAHAPGIAKKITVPILLIWLALAGLALGRWTIPAFDLWSPDPHIAAGDTALAAGLPSTALENYQQALCFSPTRSALLQKTGTAALKAGLPVSRAEALMTAGVTLFPMRPGAYGAYAGFLLETDRKAKALSVIRSGLEAHPAQADLFFALMAHTGLSPAEMFTTLPAHSLVLAKFAAHVQDTGYDFMRKAILTAAVNAADQEAEPVPWAYTGLAHLYLREKDPDQAITVLERGVARLPDNPYLLYLLALTYEQNHIFYKALDLYKKLQLLSPGYRDTEQRLKALQR